MTETFDYTNYKGRQTEINVVNFLVLHFWEQKKKNKTLAMQKHSHIKTKELFIRHGSERILKKGDGMQDAIQKYVIRETQ